MKRSKSLVRTIGMMLFLLLLVACDTPEPVVPLPTDTPTATPTRVITATPTATPTATLEEPLSATPTATLTPSPTTAPVDGPLDAQEGEGLTGVIKPGYADSLPADEKSQTVLIVDVDPNAPCWGGSLDSGGTFYMRVSTSLGSVSPETVSDAHFPAEVVLTAGATPGQAVVTVEIIYCPPRGVMVFGVCSDPGPVEQRCVVKFTVDIN